MEKADKRIIICFNCRKPLYEDDDHIVMAIGGFKICSACEARAEADIERLNKEEGLDPALAGICAEYGRRYGRIWLD